jgi:hypothetical protein
MSGSSIIGLCALFAMMIFYAEEDRFPLVLLGFAFASIVAALSDFVSGSWSFGVVALAFAAVALRRWWDRHCREGRVIGS